MRDENQKDFKTIKELKEYLANFSFDGNKKSFVDQIDINGVLVTRFINEFWTSKQRQGCSLHEISYRACFKAELPSFFIKLLTEEGDTVYDPFGGRGTTAIEAGLLGRKVISNDIAPLSKIIAKSRLYVPKIEDIKKRLSEIPKLNKKAEIDLSMFYHEDTEKEIVSLRDYLLKRKEEKKEDCIDDWIRMIATNRLTGHSKSFFSVYTLPPNQAASQEGQKKINQKRNQIPPYKDTHKIIVKKSKDLLRKLTQEQIRNIERIKDTAIFLENDARYVPEIGSNTIQLTVTSPPFLDIVQYAEDNWLRCWFNMLDIEKIGKKITMAKTVETWSSVMSDVFKELYKITAPGGWVAFEVGEVRNGTIRLDEVVVPLGLSAGFKCFGVVINQQKFTKTANIWGVSNNKFGTNTNRIVLFYKDNS